MDDIDKTGRKRPYNLSTDYTMIPRMPQHSVIYGARVRVWSSPPSPVSEGGGGEREKREIMTVGGSLPAFSGLASSPFLGACLPFGRWEEGHTMGGGGETGSSCGSWGKKGGGDHHLPDVHDPHSSLSSWGKESRTNHQDLWPPPPPPPPPSGRGRMGKEGGGGKPPCVECQSQQPLFHACVCGDLWLFGGVSGAEEEEDRRKGGGHQTVSPIFSLLLPLLLFLSFFPQIARAIRSSQDTRRKLRPMNIQTVAERT